MPSNHSSELRSLFNAHLTTLEEEGTFHNKITNDHLRILVLIGKFHGENPLLVEKGNQFKRIKNQCPSLFIHGKRVPVSAQERACLLEHHKDFTGISARQINILFKDLEKHCTKAGLDYEEIKELPFDDIPFATPITSFDIPIEMINNIFTDLNQFDVNVVEYGAVRAPIDYRRKNPTKGFYPGDLQVSKEDNTFGYFNEIETLNKADTILIGSSELGISESGRFLRSTTIESSRLVTAKEDARKEVAAKKKSTRKRKTQEVVESPPRVLSKYEIFCREKQADFNARVDAHMKKKGF